MNWEQQLRDYCKPWDNGGNGGSSLAEDIEAALIELGSLRTALTETLDAYRATGQPLGDVWERAQKALRGGDA